MTAERRAAGSDGPVDAARTSHLLAPYVPRLVVDWLHDQPDVAHRCINGTGVFADISGFTNLTERLARRGKAGAEEMGDVLNMIFEQLLAAAYEYGAGLVKWGGDAVLLLFDDDRHAEMASRAAFEMQRVIRRIGRVQTSSGVVRLRMSIGIHSGDLDFFLVGRHFRELIITGPGATAVAEMEKVAEAGEIVVSPATAALLAAAGAPALGLTKGPGLLLVGGPDVPRAPSRAPHDEQVDLAAAFSAPLRDHLLSGAVEAEHRNVTVCFVQCSGADELLAKAGSEALTEAISHFVDACQDAAVANEVTLLSSDIYQDGTKVILISGAPMSAGDDEARVLTAARSVIDAGGVLGVKAGVNCGRVFAGDYGPSYRRVYSVTGDAVNLAARLMAKAEPGQIVATPVVLERSRTAFRTEALAPFTVKGKTEPIQARLVGPIIRSRALSGGGAMPLIGRDREFSILREAAASASQGQGRVIELIGPPGIGKSRLLEELLGRIEGAVLWSDGDIYGTATPYQPMQRLLRHQLGVAEDAPSSAISTSLEELTRSVAPDLLAWLPLIGIVAGVDLPMTPEIEALDPEVRKKQLERATSDVLGRILIDPTVFIFNDVHFMDEATVDFLSQLATDARERPWLLISTRRPDTASELPDLDFLTRIELEPLDTSAADVFIAAATAHAPLPAHRAEALIARAGGNPLFLKELLAGAQESGDEEALPDSIEGVVAARIDRLAPARRRLLRSAAVLGMTVDLELLDAILSAEEAGDRAVLEQWDDLAEFVVPADQGHLRFVHHLVRETAYEGLPYRRRTILHARTADIIEQRAGERANEFADLLSLHLFHGDRFHAAWEYSRIAGNRARERYANADAADCYRRALASARHNPSLVDADVADLCESLSDVYVDLGEFDPAEQVLKQARERAKLDPVRSARLRMKTAAQRQLIGRHADALRWITRGRRILSDRDDTESLQLGAKLAEQYAYIRYVQGQHRDSIQWAERALRESESSGDLHTQARALEIQALSAAVSGRGVDTTQAKESLSLYKELGDVRGLARCEIILGMCAYFLGHWDEALEHYAQSEAAYLRVGRRVDAAISSANRAEILVDQHRLDEAERVLNEAMRVWRGAKATSEITFGNYQLGRIAARNGRFDEAFELFARARRDCQALGETLEVLTVDALTAECSLLAGRPEQALATATEAISEFDQVGGVVPAIPLLERVRGVALVQLGQPEMGYLTLRASLTAARQREAGHEIAATLGELLRLGAAKDASETAQWEQERSELMTRLGIVESESGRPIPV